MVYTELSLYAILHGTLFMFALLVQAQDQTGFISIDCGVSDFTSYTDDKTGLSYVSDRGFTDFGENRDISPSSKAKTTEQQFWNVRSFPEGTRNCYTLRPSQIKGTRYLIRTRFLYGNYDNKDEPPKFDLYLGVDFWNTVDIKNSDDIENEVIIYIPPSDHIDVCLVNIGFGNPFISVLEVRPLGSEIYKSKERSALWLYDHYDISSTTNQNMRYKEDPYDRLWTPLTWKPFISPTFNGENSLLKNKYELPLAIMRTAYTQNASHDNMHIYWDKMDVSLVYFLYMHFVELEVLQANQSREFNIYINGSLWYEKMVPSYLKETTLLETEGFKADKQGNIDIWLNNTDSATLPPLISAMELYKLKELSGQETNQTEVEAISGVKLAYELKRLIKWQGDPCSPKPYMWDGLNCSDTANTLSRIISLNLSSSGLNGEIAPSIGNLSKLEYLDLSNNNLTGTVPEFLSHLSFLKLLNLKGNEHLTVTAPILNALMKNKALILSLDSNRNSTTTLCSSCKSTNKSNLVGPLVGSLCGVSVVVIIGIAIWILKRKRKQKGMDLGVQSVNIVESREEEETFGSKTQQFSYSEIQKITRNFERVLGKGGFGMVYHGYLNGKEVAVKMLSSSSIQGQQQFQAELKLLLRVHHKNLTVLVGYCNDPNNIGLIYEYMAMGNLRSHLSGSKETILSWEDRLRIAIDTAQGLEYLHNGCKPPIVHRDVKSTNILLNEKFQAKLGDFGLSKIFPLEGHANHHVTDTRTLGITASVAGTPGYLDPEYYVTNWLNEKSDVYSFGVVLLEIITARPVLTKKRENNHIIQWVDSMLAKGDIEKIIDSRLSGDCDINTVWKAIEISMACVSTTSRNRPTLSMVLTELKECLISEVTRKEKYNNIADYSKDSSGDKSSPFMISEFSPRAR